MTETDESRAIALTYIDACARHDLDAVAPLLAADLAFNGPGRSLTGAAPYLAILRRLGAVWLRSEVKKVFSDGPEVCVIYDLVTTTPAGAVPIVEWLRIEGGTIRSVTLFFDRVAFQPATDELNRLPAG